VFESDLLALLDWEREALLATQGRAFFVELHGWWKALRGLAARAFDLHVAHGALGVAESVREQRSIARIDAKLAAEGLSARS
jgi:hypothetical protein